MTKFVTDLLDETLMNDTFQTPEQAVSQVLKDAPPYEDISPEDEIWMLKQTEEQI